LISAETINLNNHTSRHDATFAIGFVYRIPDDHKVRQRIDEADGFDFAFSHAPVFRFQISGFLIFSPDT
jgi:hypothetical protein